MGCASSSVKDPYASGYKEITYYKRAENYSTRIVENNKKETVHSNIKSKNSKY
jgi:hypothetical protein